MIDTIWLLVRLVCQQLYCRWLDGELNGLVDGQLSAAGGADEGFEDCIAVMATPHLEIGAKIDDLDDLDWQHVDPMIGACLPFDPAQGLWPNTAKSEV